MGNYCRGTATLTGDRDTLQLIYVLAERLDDCAAVSGFDGDSDWLPHIFVEEMTDEGVFYEGGSFSDNALELYIRVSRSTGCDFFEMMAIGLNLNITWDYTDDYDGGKHVRDYVPHPEYKITPWQLRTEESLDEDEEDEAGGDAYSELRSPYESQLFQSGLRQCDLIGSSSGMRPNLSTQGNVIVQTGNTVYAHCLMAVKLASTFKYSELMPEVVARVAGDLYIAGSTLVNLINKEHLVVLVHSQQGFDELRAYCGRMQSYFDSNAADMRLKATAFPNVSRLELSRLLNSIIYVFTNQLKTHPCATAIAGLGLPEDFM